MELGTVKKYVMGLQKSYRRSVVELNDCQSLKKVDGIRDELTRNKMNVLNSVGDPKLNILLSDHIERFIGLLTKIGNLLVRHKTDTFIDPIERKLNKDTITSKDGASVLFIDPEGFEGACDVIKKLLNKEIAKNDLG